MSTSRTFTAHTVTRVLDLSQQTGRIRISASRMVKEITVTVSTAAESGPSADAVNGAEFREHAGRLTVRVDSPAGGGITISGGNVVVSGNGNIAIGGNNFGSISTRRGGRIVVNGVDVTDVVNERGGARVTEIETSVTVPATAEVLLSTASADTVITGALAGLDYGGSSGDLSVETVGELNLSMSSGTARVGRVDARLNANLTSGTLRVGEYAGAEAVVNVTSGSVSVRASREASGRFSLGVTSGSARLTGASHLDVRRRVTSGSVHVS